MFTFFMTSSELDSEKAGARLESDHVYAARPARKSESRIMGRQNQVLPRALSPHQGGRQVNGVERSQRGGHGLGSTRQDRPCWLDDLHRLEEPVDGLATSGDLIVGHRLQESEAIEGAQALHFDESACHR